MFVAKCTGCGQIISGGLVAYSVDVVASAPLAWQKDTLALRCQSCAATYCNYCKKKYLKRSLRHVYRKTPCPECGEPFGPGYVLMREDSRFLASAERVVPPPSPPPAEASPTGPRRAATPASVEHLVTVLLQGGRVPDREQAARQLAAVSASSALVVGALVASWDTDAAPSVRYAAQQALLAAAHQHVWAQQPEAVRQATEAQKEEVADKALVGPPGDYRAIDHLLDKDRWAKNRDSTERLLGMLEQDGQAYKQMYVDLLERHHKRASKRLVALARSPASWLLEDGKIEATLAWELRKRHVDEPEYLFQEPFDAQVLAQTDALIAIDAVTRSGVGIPAVLCTLRQHGHVWIRAKVAEQLAKVTWDSRVVDALIGSLSDLARPQHVRSGLSDILEDPAVWEVAALSLIEIGDARGIAALTPVVLERCRPSKFVPNRPFAPNTHLKCSPAELLARGGKAAAAPLFEALRSDDKEYRDLASRALNLLVFRIDDKAAFIPLLVSALRDQEAEIRTFAAGFLGALRDERGVAALLEALQDPVMQVRAAAAAALGSIGDPRPAGIPAFAAGILGLRDERVIAERPGGLTDERLIAALLGALQDPDRDVRAAAAEALGRIGDPQAAGSLDAASADPNAKVRRAAKKALKQITRAR